MKYIFILAILIFFVSGCGTGEETNINRINEVHVKIKDGRTITCLTATPSVGQKINGISCDWGN